MLATFRRDVRAAKDRDPAARSTLEVICTYPGLHALWAHRVDHWLWRHGLRLPARLGSAVARWATAGRQCTPTRGGSFVAIPTHR